MKSADLIVGEEYALKTTMRGAKKSYRRVTLVSKLSGGLVTATYPGYVATNDHEFAPGDLSWANSKITYERIDIVAMFRARDFVRPWDEHAAAQPTMTPPVAPTAGRARQGGRRAAQPALAAS